MRQACLPAALLVATIAQAGWAETPSSAWSVSESKDAFTDKITIGLTLEATRGSGYGLTFSCEGGEPVEAGIFWLASYHGATAKEVLAVDWRVGDLPYHVGTWTVRLNKPGDALIITSTADVPDVAREMEQVDGTGAVFKLRGDGAYAAFPVDGFTKGWRELTAKCLALGS